MPSRNPPNEHHLELVGTVYATEPTDDGRELLTFICTNKETFRFFLSKAIKPIPIGTLVKAWVRRLEDELGFLTNQAACIHWEIFK